MWLSLWAWSTFRPRAPLAMILLIVFSSSLIRQSTRVMAQTPQPVDYVVKPGSSRLSANSPGSRTGIDPVQAISANDMVRHALASNAALAAARLEIERMRARLRQAGLRPNPAVDFEQTNGVFESPGETATSIGLSVPLELGGKRQRRIDLARAELAAAEAEIADRKRRLANEVHAAYAEVLAAQRELGITAQLNDVEVQTASVVRTRVEEGDAAPLELSLLRVEIERLRSRRALVEGRLEAASFKLKQVAGISPSDPLRLREELLQPQLPEPPSILETAINNALNSRPDLRLARLTEEVARSGHRLAQAQSAPELTAFARYSVVRSTFDNTPIGSLSDRDELFTFGVSISLPFFNRNQGAKAEAEVAISQAQQRRQFVEAMVRSEVGSAWKRYEAASIAVQAFEQGVIPRSNENITAIRGAYQVGAFRVTELLAEQRRLIDAQREYTEALTERYRALADLQAALGVTIKQ